MRDLKAEVLKLRSGIEADVEAGIEAQFKNEGALR